MGGRGSSSGMRGKNGGGKYGEYVKTYKNGTKEYRKANSSVTGKELEREYRLMDSVIEREMHNKFDKQYGRANVSYDRNDGLVTVYTDSVYERKLFFKTTVKGTKVTHVRKDGSVDTYHTDHTYGFEFVGSKM